MFRVNGFREGRGTDKGRLVFSPLLRPLSAIWTAITAPRPANVELTGRVSHKYAVGSDGKVTGHATSADMDVAEYYVAEYAVIVSQTKFLVSGRLYDSVEVGDEVVVTVHGGRWVEDPSQAIPNSVKKIITIGASSAALRVADVEARQADRKFPQRHTARRLARRKRARGNARETSPSDVAMDPGAVGRARATLGGASYKRRLRQLSATLSDLGIEAHAMEPTTGPDAADGEEDLWGWLEVADGPIRWVGITPTCSYCWVPDSRIGSGNSTVSIAWDRADHWYVNDDPQFAKGWSSLPLEQDLSARIVRDLGQDATILVGFDLETDLAQSSWILVVDSEFTGGIWHSCQRVAEALLVSLFYDYVSS